MIKRIVKVLKSVPGIDDYQIAVVNEDRREAYYVQGKRETVRRVETVNYAVTVFRKLNKAGKDLLGSSTFQLPYIVSQKTLEKRIEEALYSAAFVENRAYTLPQGDGKRHVFRSPSLSEDPWASLEAVAAIYESVAAPKKKFNALELFYISTTIHLVNSQGIDYVKNRDQLDIEAIPSFDGVKPEDPANQKVELYKYFKHRVIDLEAIRAEAVHALDEAEARFGAQKLPVKGKLDVVIKEDEVESLCRDLISNLSYAGVYNHATDKQIGDVLQNVKDGEALTIGLDRLYPADKFDGDGVLLTPVTVIKRGKVASYYGNNRYAQYLGMKPTGNLGGLTVALGKSDDAAMFSGPHLEIISLSGIQIDIYSGYIGGEVRLAYYHDGHTRIPVSGFSFSGSLFGALEGIRISMTAHMSATYAGPKYVRLPAMEVL